MVNYSVLTYIIGDYEKIHELEFEPLDNVEYICVTDNPNLKSNTWKIYYDKDLDDDKFSAFDRVFLIRYNLFKYAKNDICVRLDGSLGLFKPLDEIVEKFIDGNYDGCLNIHVGRDNILDEYLAWVECRNFPALEALKHIKVLTDELKYNFSTLGLYEQSFSINRKTELTKRIDREMIDLLFKCGTDGHLTRLDQTVFSAYINTFHFNKKFMFVDDYLMVNNFYHFYKHGSNEKMHCLNRMSLPYFCNKIVNIVR